MSDRGELAELEKLASALLGRVSAGERTRVLRAIARDVRAGQRARITRQQDPDGTSYPRRRQQTGPRPGNYALKFLYPKGAAEPRLVFMRSWVHQGPLITGYDQEAGAIRSFFWDRVAEFLPVPAADQNVGAGRLRRRRIRDRAMFRKLAGPRYLRAGATDAEAWIGYENRAEDVARIHQEGGMDRPTLKAKPVRYARRMLLGLTPEDLAGAMNRLLEHVAG